MKSHGSGKLITLSAILDLLIFTISLKLNKDFIAGGIIIAVMSNHFDFVYLKITTDLIDENSIPNFEGRSF
jgi:hypothetical protein